jgi:hypothetical protein
MLRAGERLAPSIVEREERVALVPQAPEALADFPPEPGYE